MRLMVLVASIVVSSWAGTARASGLLDTPMELKLSFPSAPAAPDSALHLVDVQQSFGLLAAGQVAGSMDPGTRGILALALTFFIGFGTGHFVLGDGAAVLFLLLDAGCLVGYFVIVAAAAAAIVAGVPPVWVVVAPLLLVAYLGIRIWEFVDTLFKSGLMAGGKKLEAILPGGGLQVGAPPFAPMAANGLNWRF